MIYFKVVFSQSILLIMLGCNVVYRTRCLSVEPNVRDPIVFLVALFKTICYLIDLAMVS
jgi:hypothetical protein